MNIRISKKVEEALKNKKPVVALESTIISHGMPYPKNVETALKVEKEISAEREKSFKYLKKILGSYHE